MSILRNAIDSIQVGIEDYENEDERRSVSAVRNIAAGILLLYKEKLCRMSPEHDKELLIRKNIRPVHTESGDLIFEGKGTNTVDVQSIKERFNSLKVKVDWKRFDEINQLRNNLEHYYTSKSPDAVREIVSKSFLLIRDFISNEFAEEPQELIGADSWSVFLDVADVYAVEDIGCKESIRKIDWKYDAVRKALEFLRCPECHSSLIQASCDDGEYPEVNLTCRSCSYAFCFSDVIETCIDDSLSGEAFIAVKDGGETPYDTCLECDKGTFIYSEGCCVACGYEMEYSHCDRCEQPLSLDEQYHEGMCDYCQYQFEKVMAE